MATTEEIERLLCHIMELTMDAPGDGIAVSKEADSSHAIGRFPTKSFGVNRDRWKAVMASEGFPENRGKMWYVTDRDPVLPRREPPIPAECDPDARAQGILGNLNEYGAFKIPEGIRLRIAWGDVGSRSDVGEAVKQHWSEAERLHKSGHTDSREFWGIYGVVINDQIKFDKFTISPIDPDQGAWLRHENETRGVGNGPQYVQEAEVYRAGQRITKPRGPDQGVVVQAPVEILTTCPDQTHGIAISQGYDETKEVRRLRYAMTLAGGRDVHQGFTVAGGEWWGIPLVNQSAGMNPYRPRGKGVIDLRNKEHLIEQWYRKVTKVDEENDKLYRAMLVANETIRDTSMSGFVTATNLLRILECLAAETCRRKGRKDGAMIRACVKAWRIDGECHHDTEESVRERLLKVIRLRVEEAHYINTHYEP